MFLLCYQFLVIDAVKNEDRVWIARGPKEIKRRNGAAGEERYPQKNDKRQVYGGSRKRDFQRW